MAYALTHDIAHFGLKDRVKTLISRIKLARARRLAFNANYAELLQMSQRELDDFGLTRGDLVDLARAEADKITSA